MSTKSILLELKLPSEVAEAVTLVARSAQVKPATVIKVILALQTTAWGRKP